MNNLNKEIVHTFKWYKKLTKRFIDLAFLPTTMVVIATLFSQLFMLISSMMPLKVIMLLGSPIVPKYFPNSWQSIPRDMLIVYLAIASVGFFVLYLLSEKVISIYAQKGANKILKNNQKVVLFENQDTQAQKYYTIQSKSLADIVFFILAWIGLGVLYPLLGLIIGLFLVFSYVGFFYGYKIPKYQKKIDEELHILLDLLKGIGFFIVFAFILGSFLGDFYAPNIIVALIAVLLIRQMFGQLRGAVRSVVNLYKARLKVNSLFFYGHTQIKISHDKKDPFWNLLEKQHHKKWIPAIFTEILDEEVKYIQSSWYKLNIKNIAILEITVLQKAQEQKYFVKIFNKNITSQAIHEASFLETNKENKLSLKFIGTTTLEEFHINIFEDKGYKELTQKEFGASHHDIRLHLMDLEINSELKDRYTRSHPYLYKRISKQMIEKLSIVAKDDEVNMIMLFEKSFDSILNTLQKSSLQIINPHLTKFNLIKQNDEKISLIHWGAWKIDLLGVDYPIDVNSIKILKERYKSETENIDEIVLTAFMSQFEKLYNGENFTAIMELLPRILECLKNEK